MNATALSAGISWDDCASLLSADKRGSATDLILRSVSTDTRTAGQGDIFVALIGPNFDAHDHCQQAMEAGAAGLIVQRPVACDLPQLIVDDCRLALGKLARAWAERLQVPIIAVTGSNGKTTVKEMIRSILSELGEVHATEGNLNNEIGLPLTLLKIQPEHQYAVVEMGANHVGEIGYLSNIAQPDVALITNISSAHLEGFGSLDATAAAKSEIFTGVSEDGYAVVNADDHYFATMKKAATHCRVLSFGSESGVDVRGGFIDGVFTIKLRDKIIQPKMKLLGEHNRLNAVTAAAAALCLDVQGESICRGLEAMQAVNGRLQSKRSKAGALVIDDTYNANPASVEAAIKVLSEQAGKLVLVLGDMKELGPEEVALHAQVGDLAREAGIHSLYTVGPLAAHAAHAFGESGVSFTDKHELIEALAKYHPRSTTFLVKGSRGARMEEVVSGLLAIRGNGATCGASVL